MLAALLAVAPPALAQPPSSAAARDDPFAARAWHLQLGGHALLETWNYNVSHEEVYGIAAGLTYGLRDGLAIAAAGPLQYVSQRGVDAWVLGGTVGLRARVYRRPRWSLYVGIDVGVSHADTYTPPRGTRFNYLLIGGGGMTARIRPGLHLLAGLQWTHVSNNGLAGHDRNPDLEAVGPQVGVLIGF